MLAHRGLQIKIERTKEALEATGIHVEYLLWWDNSDKGDISRLSWTHKLLTHRFCTHICTIKKENIKTT
jgi:hypothetical protein